MVRIVLCNCCLCGNHSFRKKFNVNNDNDRAALLKHFYKFHFDVLNAKTDITECFMVLFLEQPDKTFVRKVD